MSKLSKKLSEKSSNANSGAALQNAPVLSAKVGHPPNKQDACPNLQTTSKSVDKLTFVEPSPIARRLLWHIFSIGARRLNAPDHHEPFEKPGAHLFWVQSGDGELRHETGRFALKSGRRLWLIDMSKPRTYIPASKRNLTLTGFRFGGPGLEFWHEQIGGNHQSEFVIKDFEFVRRTQSELLRLAKRQPSGWEWQVHVIITNLLGKLLMSRDLLVSPHAEMPLPMSRVLNAIAANPLKDWKTKELGTVAKVSYSLLRTLFRNSGQGTLHHHIQQMRLDHARLLLADRRLSIKDVAAQLNFSSEFYFSHFFRKQTGICPRSFREHLQSRNRS
ncbi:MAG: AraC family transcriptional regulator [Verrucomicrobiota bacterium]